MPSGRCAKHDAQHRAQTYSTQDSNRGTSSQRGYDAAWQRCRRLFLAEHPFCSILGCGERATEADHVIPVSQAPDLRLSWSNLRPMCKPHHSQRTARDQSFGRSVNNRANPDTPKAGGCR